MVAINRQNLTAVATSILIFCLGLIAIKATQTFWENTISAHIRQLTNDQARLLENKLNSSLTAAKILAIHVHSQNGVINDFAEIAKTLHQDIKGISILQLSPGGITTRSYPENSFNQQFSVDIFKDKHYLTEAQRARDSGQLRLSDPISFEKNGQAVVALQPIYLHQSNLGESAHQTSRTSAPDHIDEEFWGFSSVIIRLQPLLEQTLLPNLTEQNYAYRLNRASTKTGQLQLIAGQGRLSNTLWSQHSINLPDEQWFLAIAYQGGSLGFGWIVMLISLNICITLLAGYWFFTLIRRQQTLKLQRQVNQRTRELNSNNLQLQHEKLELKKFKNAVNESGNSIVITNVTGTIEYVNTRFTEVTGYTAEEAIGNSPSILKSPFTQQEEHADLWRALSHGKKWRGERRNVRKNGAIYWSLMSISPIKDASGAITHFVSVSEDITENKEIQLQVEKLAYHDPLTGLNNRRYFMNQLEHQCRLCERSNELAAVLFMDLDHFKMVNDTLGHEFGDELLKLVARKIISCLRDSDIPSRLGGDEFTILLPRLQSEADAIAVADKLVRVISEPFTLADNHLQQSISIGISIIRGQGLSAKQILHQADQALYTAKQFGRNQYRLYEKAEPSCDDDTTTSTALSAAPSIHERINENA